MRAHDRRHALIPAMPGASNRAHPIPPQARRHCMGADIIATGKASFDQDVLQSQLPVLVDYWAEWCAPCKAIGPILDELAVEYQGKLRIAKVDMDADVQIGQKYGVRGMPTLMIFKNGSGGGAE